jgi:septum formation protein
VIAADTVLQTFFPGPGELPKILEKPDSPADQLSVLEELMNAPPETRVSAVTGVAIVYPTLASPGYIVKTLGETSRLWFGDVGRESLVA